MILLVDRGDELLVLFLVLLLGLLFILLVNYGIGVNSVFFNVLFVLIVFVMFEVVLVFLLMDIFMLFMFGIVVGKG